jgi:formylglycine-generating enzyme required for sulfatase activity
MIKGPAEAAGLRIAESLVEAIIRDAGDEPGALPLIEFALSRLYEKRAGSELTEEAYRDIGGLTGAINDWSEEAVRESDGAIKEHALFHLFQAIASVQNVDGKTVVVRKRALLTSLDSEALPLCERLIAARLLITGSDPAPYVEVAHEALFTRWRRLWSWLEEHRDALTIVRHVQSEAVAWSADPTNPLHQPWPAEAQSLAYAALSRLGRSWDSEAEPLCSFLRPEANRLVDELRSDGTDHFRRAAIGERLDAIGDPRPGIGVQDGVPDIEWVDIMSGWVELRDDDNQPIGKFWVDPFRIARYPVTGAQYQAFLESDDGYRSAIWWSGLVRPDQPGDRQGRFSNYPMTRVSWFEASAFCRWLSSRMKNVIPVRCVIRLPCEWEWQQAACGGDASREYPWGEWLDDRANTMEGGLGRATAVGLYPHGTWLSESAMGPLDMSGGVLEWCQNQYEHFREQALSDDESQRVMRGGSWRVDRNLARCVVRLGDHPRGRFQSVGFRVCCATALGET